MNHTMIAAVQGWCPWCGDLEATPESVGRRRLTVRDEHALRPEVTFREPIQQERHPVDGVLDVSLSISVRPPPRYPST